MIIFTNNTHEREFTAALYCRVSREDEGGRDESVSIETQRLKLTSYANYKKINVHHTYCDDGVSGTTFDRPGLNSMLSDIIAQRINCVIVKDLSRLGREYRQSGMLLEDFFPKYGTRFIAIDDGIDRDPLRLDPTASNLMLVLNNVINEMYPCDISRKTRSALQAKAKGGQYVAASAPYGYIKSKDDKNKLLPSPDTALWVNFIFKEIANGTSLSGVTKKLHSLNCKTPKDLKCGTHLYNWNSSTIGSIIRNQTYLGKIVYGKTYRVLYKNKDTVLRPSSEWCIVDDAHEPLVSEELYTAANKALLFRHTEHLGNTQHPFMGKLHCPDCGNLLNFCLEPRKNNPNEGYFVCRTNKKFGKSHCTRHYVRLSTLANAIHNQLLYFHSIAKCDKLYLYRTLISRQELAQIRIREPIRTRLELSEKKAATLNTAFSEMYLEKIDGRLTSQQYDVLMYQYSSDKSELEKQMLSDKKYLSSLDRQTQHIDTFIDLLLKSEISNLDYTLVNKLIDKIIIYDTKTEYGNKHQTAQIYFRHIGFIGDIDLFEHENI